jgi:tRNA nucleotidyltransferase (CCA-adding enzyme)
MRIQIPARDKRVLEKIGTLADDLGVRAYAVGGCVRDWLLRRRVGKSDLDIVVEGNGIAVAEAAARVLGGQVRAHEQFGTATLASGERRIDFATCRRETYAAPAAYPKVSAGTLRDDLFRRDYTINAVAVALDRPRRWRIMDPFHGAADLRRKHLRVLHAKSFIDDPSRLLRGVRFLVRFGLRWEPSTERAAREAIRAGAIGWLNAGRLRKELDRIAAEPDPRACLEAFAGLFARVGPSPRAQGIRHGRRRAPA